ncbi:MAG: 30S ribosomal protein S8 [Planctomycetota bacterium]|nr:30S ribosomal protein S8 [Planctomycetota bacterium]
MTMTDPIADMLTRMRNALRIERNNVTIPRSKIKVGIAEVLKREGYIENFEVDETGPQGSMKVNLKYGPNGEQVISSIRRVSKPGRRLYSTVQDLKPVLNGLGILVLSTSKGILSDREARKQSVGGELLCEIY